MAASYGATDSVATSITSFGGPATMRSPGGWEWTISERDEDRASSIRGRGRARWVEEDSESDGDTTAGHETGHELELEQEGYAAYDIEAGVSGDGDDGYESGDSATDSDSASTVSDSSIIDLPRPRPLHPITLPDSTSMGALAELAGAVEAAAGVVRRSTSARFGRSAEDAGGYGTFGGR